MPPRLSHRRAQARGSAASVLAAARGSAASLPWQANRTSRHASCSASSAHNPAFAEGGASGLAQRQRRRPERNLRTTVACRRTTT
eukprot:262981-Pyramimonas_sp.AAC.1